jgi:hypothetical protein
VERLWWTVKYHYFHPHSFGNGLELRKGLRCFFEYYNRERMHQALNRMTPDEYYFKEQEKSGGLMVRRQPGQLQSHYGLIPWHWAPPHFKYGFSIFRVDHPYKTARSHIPLLNVV